jgi:hypothetical protein
VLEVEQRAEAEESVRLVNRRAGCAFFIFDCPFLVSLFAGEAKELTFFIKVNSVLSQADFLQILIQIFGVYRFKQNSLADHRRVLAD